MTNSHGQSHQDYCHLSFPVLRWVKESVLLCNSNSHLHSANAHILGAGLPDCLLDISPVNDVVGNHGKVVMTKVDGLPQDTRRVIVRSNTEEAHLPLFLEVEEGLVDPGRVQLFGGVGPVRAHQAIKVVCPHSLQARLDRFDDEAAETRAPVHLVPVVRRHGVAQVSRIQAPSLAGKILQEVTGLRYSALSQDLLGPFEYGSLLFARECLEDLTVQPIPDGRKST